MSLSDSLLGHLLATAGSLLAIAAIVAFRTLVRRRMSARKIVQHGAAERDRPFRRSIPATVALVHSQLHELADDVDDDLPRQFRLIDRLIDESDREIARLQRHLVSFGSASVTLSRRQPDVLLPEDFEPDRTAAPAVPHVDDRTIRRAA